MSVGDVNSTERGSGARFNDGKPPLHLIPAGVLALWETATCGGQDVREDDASDFLDQLASWQKGQTAAGELLKFVSLKGLEEAAFVFAYGAQKYAAWNWAKGMPWSVPLGCILRHHLTPRAEDEESGRLHWGHVVCNIIMLVHFEDHYPEGDDRPPAACWGPEPEEEEEEERAYSQAEADAVFKRALNEAVDKNGEALGLREKADRLEPLPAYMEFLKNPRGE